jgi:hypothetical protein
MHLEHHTKYHSAVLSAHPIDTDAAAALHKPLSASLSPARQSGFIGKKLLDVNKRYKIDTYTLEEEFKSFTSFYSRVERAYEHLLTDYSRKIVLPTTCAMGFHKKTHTDMDASRELGVDTASKDRVDPKVNNVVVDWYKKFLVPDTELKLSLPRGKNIGWPHPIGGRQRELADVLLALNAALALGGRAKGFTLDDLLRFLAQFHGDEFMIEGDRTQHSGKILPSISAAGLLYSQGFEPRVRGIRMSPKVAVAFSRKSVKRLTQTILKHPVHTQDRPVIQQRIRTALSKGWKLYPFDFSKFDYHAGREVAKRAVKLIGDILGSPQVADDLWREISIKLLVFADKKAYFDDSVPVLPSGAGSTTLVGCITNMRVSLAVLSQLLEVPVHTLPSLIQKKYDLLLWGDDGLLMLPDLGFDIEPKLIEMFDQSGFPISMEPVARYLGSVYGNYNFDGTYKTGYDVGRAIQTLYFPERLRDYPFSTVGLIARLSLMEDGLAKEFFSVHTSHFWDDKVFGPRFQFSDRFAVMDTLLPLLQKQSNKISQIDDILMILTKGVEPDDLTDDFEFEEFLDLLGQSAFNISDPLSELDSDSIPPEIKKGIRNIISGQFEDYQTVLNLIQFKYNLTYRPGDVLY